MITKKDIAEKLGISRTTVSMVLNRKPDARISEETAQRVLAMARKLGYKEQSDMETQSLICYILCNRRLDNPSYFDNLRILEAVASESYFRIIFATVDHTEDDYEKLANLLKSSSVKGAVIAGDFNKNIIELIKGLDVPFVANGVTDIDGINLVSPDHHRTGYEATEYLIRLGHREIAFFTGELHKLTHKKLLDGYREALKDNNISYNPSLIQVSSQERGDDLIKRAKELGINYSAILAANEQIGVDALTELKAERRKVPEEVSIIAIGGGSLGIQCRPKLSVVASSGKKCARLMLEIIERNINNLNIDPQKEIITTTLIERESTGPFRD